MPPKLNLRETQVLNLMRLIGYYERWIAQVLQLEEDEVIAHLGSIQRKFQTRDLQTVLNMADQMELWQFKKTEGMVKITLDDLEAFNETDGNRAMLGITGTKGKRLRNSHNLWPQLCLARFLAKRLLDKNTIRHNAEHCRITLDAICTNPDVNLKLLEMELFKTHHLW